ncbi:MAG: amino acid racemase [Desulfovibrio sp.]|jgi:aspartate racemase|nr:amino acid racemase [Desulfovibrio sp.]
MNGRHERIAGILGGMGPEATVDLMQRIIRNTPASDDADHVRCLVDLNPKVPSRIKALIDGDGEDPAPAMIRMAQGLEASGADFLAIACNTAHHYHGRVRDAVGIPVLDMVCLAVRAAKARMPAGGSVVGILASPAVRMVRLYEEAMRAEGLRPLYLDPPDEDRLFAVIKAVKQGDTGPARRAELSDAVGSLQARGADVCLVACTELSALLEGEDDRIVDAAETLAREIVRKAKGGT